MFLPLVGLQHLFSNISSILIILGLQKHLTVPVRMLHFWRPQLKKNREKCKSQTMYLKNISNFLKLIG